MRARGDHLPGHPASIQRKLSGTISPTESLHEGLDKSAGLWGGFLSVGLVVPTLPLRRFKGSTMQALAFSKGNVLRRTAVATAVLSITLLPQSCWAATRALFDTSDIISSEHLQSGGGCENGCVRRVVDAVARAYGDINCELRVQNLLDHIGEDVTGGALNVVHSCTDADGNLRYQGEGDCLYDVCVSAEWGDGRIYYSVTVEHEATTQPHSVRLQVYLNEYELDVDDDKAPTSTRDLQCSLGGECSTASQCGADTSAVEVLMEDDYGDGWMGAMSDRLNTWTMTQALSADNYNSLVANGTLPEGHYSATTSMCLDHGAYAFGSTSNAAWSSDGRWTVCGVEGGLGGSMEFEVDEDGCSDVDDSNADGPPSSDAETDAEDYCSLPQASPCTEIDTGVLEVSGPSVGMHYDKTCLDGGGEVPGCNGGGVSTCRLCFVNRDIWEMDFPNERVPDWPACPCCVANFMDVTCRGQFNNTEISISQTAMEKAQEDFVNGTTPVLAGLGTLLAVCWILACCCYRSIHKEQNKTLTYKHGRVLRDSICATAYDGDGKTPPGVSPPQDHCKDKDKKDIRKQNALEVLEVDLSASAAETGLEATVANSVKQGKKSSVSPMVIAREVPFERAALAQNGSPPPLQLLPGASQERPPSDASWPTDSHVGISVDGRKHPRWSGSRELHSYLRRTGYGKVDATTILEGKEPKGEDEDRKGGSNIVKAIKRAGSFLNDGSKVEQGGRASDPWAVQGSDMPGAATAAAADAHLNMPLGDLPVPPSPTNGPMPMVVPVSITTVRSGEVEISAPRRTRSWSRSHSGSRSRSSSRSRSRPSIAPTDEPDYCNQEEPKSTAMELEPEHSKRFGKIEAPLLDGDDDSSCGAWVGALPDEEATHAPEMALVSASERKTPVPSKRGKRGNGRPPKVSPPVTGDVSAVQRCLSRGRPEPVDQSRFYRSQEPAPAPVHTAADGVPQTLGREQDDQKHGVDEDGKRQRRSHRDRRHGDGDTSADMKTRRRTVATKSQPAPSSSSPRERSRSRHKNREDFKGYRRKEREASEKRGRDNDPRRSAEGRGEDGAISKGVPSVKNIPAVPKHPETEAERRRRRAREEALNLQQRAEGGGKGGAIGKGVPSIENIPAVPKQSEAERRRRRTREEALNLQQHQGEEHRGDHSKNRSKERNEDGRGDPPEYDSQWASRRRGKNVEPQEPTAASQVEKQNGYDGQGSRHLEERDSRAVSTVGDAAAVNGVARVEDATATRPVGLSKTSSMMKFSNDPRARLARNSKRKARLQKQESEGVDGTG